MRAPRKSCRPSWRGSPTPPRAHGVLGQLLLSRNDLTPAQRSFERELVAGSAVCGSDHRAGGHRPVAQEDERGARQGRRLSRAPPEPAGGADSRRQSLQGGEPAGEGRSAAQPGAGRRSFEPGHLRAAGPVVRLAKATGRGQEAVHRDRQAAAPLGPRGDDDGACCATSAATSTERSNGGRRRSRSTRTRRRRPTISPGSTRKDAAASRSRCSSRRPRSRSIPNLPEVNDTLGWVYYRKDLIGQAILFLQQSLDMEPHNPVYHYHLGMAYARKGEDAKARRLLEAALRIDPKFSNATLGEEDARVARLLAAKEVLMTTTQKNWTAAALIAAGFVALYWDVVAKLVMAWYTDDNYSHGFLIVPLAALPGVGAPRPLSGDRDPAERVRAGRRRGQPAAADGRHPRLRTVHDADLDHRHARSASLLFLFGWGRLRVLAFPIALPVADDSDSGDHLQSDCVSRCRFSPHGSARARWSCRTSRCFAKATS